MSEGSLQRLEELLAGALELPPEERAGYLEEACGDARRTPAPAGSGDRRDGGQPPGAVSLHAAVLPLSKPSAKM